MNWQQLIEHARRFYPAVFLERLLPSSLRRTAEWIFGTFTIFFTAAILFAPSISLETSARSFFLSLSFFLLFFMLESFYLSFSLTGLSTSLYESGQLRALHPVAFDVAEILHSTSPLDVTAGFLASSPGKEIVYRLGIVSQELKSFLSSRTERLSSNSLTFPAEVGLSSYASILFEKDNEFSRFLFSKNIQREEWEGAARFVENVRNRARRRERWWGRDNLARIKSIGVEWSYGKTYTLDKYARPVEPIDSSRFDQEVTSLETILSRAREANAVIVSDVSDYALSVVSALAARIVKRVVFSPIEHKRLMLLDTESLVASAGNKTSFEREFLSMLNQSVKAGNIILVIPEFAVFVRNALALGSDVLALLDSYLSSPDVQVIALSDPDQYHQTIERDERLARLFEKIWVRDRGTEGALSLIEERLSTLEAQEGVFFTYQGALMIAKGAARYMTEGTPSEKALDLLIELVAVAKKNKKHFIEERDVLALIESKTGIPTGGVGEKEKEILTNLESILHERIVGQDEAVSAISNTMKRSRSGIVNPNRPLGSFLFLGPTGVGKTETAKTLAQVFFGSEDKMVRLDMSEYNSGDALDRMLGSFTTGTVGMLTSLIREHPYGVLLLDEFEKAHSEVHDLFLQILDEGMFSDMFGKKVNARNAIIIATSNAGSDVIWNMVKQGVSLQKEERALVDTLIQNRIFKPELLNRFDEVIIFHPLEGVHLNKIAELMLEKLKKRLYEKGYDLLITPALVDFLVREGSDPQFGARPLNRAIQERIEKVIAERIISGTIKPGSKVELNESDLS